MRLSLFIIAHRTFFLICVTLLMVNLVIFGATNPFTSAVTWIIVGFTVLCLDLSVIMYGLLRYLRVVFPYVRSHFRRLYVVLTVLSIILLALSSIGQLTWRDVFAVGAVAVVAYFYAFYAHTSLRRKQ